MSVSARSVTGRDSERHDNAKAKDTMAIKPTVQPLPEILPIHDLTEAACLYASGFAPVTAEWRGPRLYLIFPDSPDARRVLRDLAQGQLRFDPHTILDGFRQARRLLFEAKKEAGRLHERERGLQNREHRRF